MSHGELRVDKKCQNCGCEVEERYCSHCGQENIETRQKFHYLFTHFIEDFVHYDGSFWQTVKKLYFKPGFVTKKYLSGKRISTVNPVKLYIFISFVTFFLMAVFPVMPDSKPFIDGGIEDGLPDKELVISFDNRLNHDQINNRKYSEEEIQKELNKELPILRPLVRKGYELANSGLSKDNIRHKFSDKMFSLLPKTLFVYMPIFAFVVWLFYNKKRWWYFDHGIYTLHYFSVLLLGILTVTLLSRISDWINIGIIDFVIEVFNYLLLIYLIINFYIGSYNLYNESKIVTFIKGSFILFINSIILGVIMIGILIYTFLHIE
jgi:hypothetical protein